MVHSKIENASSSFHVHPSILLLFSINSASRVVVQVMVWDSLLKDLTAKSPSAVDWYEPPFFIYVIVALMVQCSPTLTLAVVRIRGERIQLWAVCLRREEIAGIGSIEESKHKERKGRAVSWAAEPSR